MSGQSAARRVLITGSGGFVGGYLIRELLNSGYASSELHGVTFGRQSQQSSEIQSHVCDLRDAADIQGLIQRVQPTAVIHLAAVALPSQARQDPGAAWAINFDAVRHLGQAILTHVPDATMVFAGSSESYGASFNLCEAAIDEATPLRPTTPYAATKAAADIALGQMRHDGLKVSRFRAFNHTGPGQSPDYVVSSFAQQIARIAAEVQPPVIRVGNLEAERDFLDVRDVVMAYRLAIETCISPSSEGVFNLASGMTRTIQSILEQLIEIGGVSVSVVTDPEKLRRNDVPRTLGSSWRAQQELGWYPRFAFEQTLKDTFDAARLVA